MVNQDSDIRTIIIPAVDMRRAADDARETGMAPVLARVPSGARLVSSFLDTETGDFHIHYRPAAPELAEPAPEPEEVRPGPILLSHSARVIPLERVAMVAHEMIRTYRIATKGAPLPPWGDLDQRDKLAEMGRCSLLRDESITVSDLFANSNRIPDEQDKARDRAESALRACVVQAFNLST